MKPPKQSTHHISYREMAEIGGDDIPFPELDEVSEELVDELHEKLGQSFRVGDEIMALCPFHNDHTVGSFYLNIGTGLFYCWSCQAGGGLPKLLRKIGVGQGSGGYRGVPLERLTEYISGKFSASADDIPVEFLPALPEETLDHFSVVDDFRNHWASLLEAMEVGYDPLFNRIVFPVRTYRGDLVGIQSRSLDPESKLRWKFYKSEYQYIVPWDDSNIVTLLNYEVPRASCLYGESRVWGWFSSKSDLPLVLCEGPGHWLRITEAGYPALATFGTSVSAVQLSRLKAAMSRKRGAEVILCYDGDSAGLRAMSTLGDELALTATVRVASLPEGKDPEDLSVPALQEVLSSAELLELRRLEPDWILKPQPYRPRGEARYQNSEHNHPTVERPAAPSRYWVMKRTI